MVANNTKLHKDDLNNLHLSCDVIWVSDKGRCDGRACGTQEKKRKTNKYLMGNTEWG